MNRTFKFALAALALAAIAPANAQQSETSSSEPVGWTPVALGLATPVQLPWGLNRWDVYGLDVNLFYSDAPDVIGLDVGGLATVVRKEMKGLQVGGLFNFNGEDVYGLRATLGLNLARRSVYGMEAGLLAFSDNVYGLSVHFLGAAQHNVSGLQVSGLANVTETQSYGCTIAGACNLARISYGLQLALIYNMTDELHGAQIGLVNFADYCPNGFQIGLVNIIMSNKVKVLPFVNGYF